MPDRLDIAFFGSSLVSAYWNGAATYYRGILKALARCGHTITFYEPDAFGRQQHRDLVEDPDYARVVVYPANEDDDALKALEQARDADLIVKASGVGVFDDLLALAVVQLRRTEQAVVFWDVDAPATLDEIASDEAHPLRALVPQYNAILTYGGGPPVTEAYRALGARRCTPIYNALDPETHHPAAPLEKFQSDLAFLGNRLPDREQRVREFFFEPARRFPNRSFLLGGAGWADLAEQHANVRYLDHVYTSDHNAFNSTPLAVLNVTRDSMVRYGHSPATRVFEAAGAGACLISDLWTGLENFLEPGKECIAAASGDEVCAALATLTPERRARIGAAARVRALAEHTYDQRARLVEKALGLKRPVGRLAR